MKVLIAASEVAPFAKTGGLADVCGALPYELMKQGVEVRVVMPKYALIPDEYTDKMVYKKHIFIKMGWRSQYCGILELVHKDIKFYFIDNEFYYGGSQIYGNINEDIEKYAFFSKAVLEILPEVDFKPDVIHSNDWQTGMVPVLYDAHFRWHPFYSGIKHIMTIHNLKFQGVYNKSTLQDLCDLRPDYFTPDKLEFYSDANCLKGGLVYADKITTVSRTYANEIKYPHFGEGLDGLMRARSESLWGILNGIDYEDYNPRTDPWIYDRYDGRNAITKKRINKTALQADLGLEVNKDRFLIGMISRITAQKGFDLVNDALNDIMQIDGLQLVVLGTGEEHYQNMLRHFAWKYPGKLAACITFDNLLAHKIYAASDAFLMPSYFEPCGLSQMISMRYGTLPIVRETGGLADTVEPYNKYEGTGNGFSFSNYNRHEMMAVIKLANQTFYDKPAWSMLMRHAMAKDFSWKMSAAEYIKLYKEVIG